VRRCGAAGCGDDRSGGRSAANFTGFTVGRALSGPLAPVLTQRHAQGMASLYLIYVGICRAVEKCTPVNCEPLLAVDEAGPCQLRSLQLTRSNKRRRIIFYYRPVTETSGAGHSTLPSIRQCRHRIVPMPLTFNRGCCCAPYKV
jgi:hypothetical protein